MFIKCAATILGNSTQSIRVLIIFFYKYAKDINKINRNTDINEEEIYPHKFDL